MRERERERNREREGLRERGTGEEKERELWKLCCLHRGKRHNTHKEGEETYVVPQNIKCILQNELAHSYTFNFIQTKLGQGPFRLIMKVA